MNSVLNGFSSAWVSGPNLATSATGLSAGRKLCSSAMQNSFSRSKKLTEDSKQMEKRRRVGCPSLASERVALQSRSLRSLSMFIRSSPLHLNFFGILETLISLLEVTELTDSLRKVQSRLLANRDRKRTPSFLTISEECKLSDKATQEN